MYTIGYLVKNFALSRSTLLYYDKIGLLKPSGRSDANYRLYTQDDVRKMEQIALYKEAGLTLEAIANLLEDRGSNKTHQLLKLRLSQLNEEINALRTQQQLLVGLLGDSATLMQTKVMTKNKWVAILRASGMSDEDMRLWHIEFEASMPEAHEDFLQSLGIEAHERAVIRRWQK